MNCASHTLQVISVSDEVTPAKINYASVITFMTKLLSGAQCLEDKWDDFVGDFLAVLLPKPTIFL